MASGFDNLFQRNALPSMPADGNLGAFNALNEDKFKLGAGTVKTSTIYQIVQWLGPISKVVIALTLIWLLISFVICSVQLAECGDNPKERSHVLENFKHNFIAMAVVGGAASIAALFSGVLAGG